MTLGAAAPAASAPPVPPPKSPVAVGYGGAVSSVDADASAAGIEVLRKGGNAVDAAVATAAALGVTEPYSAGIGGGGYFVHYDARTGTGPRPSTAGRPPPAARTPRSSWRTGSRSRSTTPSPADSASVPPAPPPPGRRRSTPGAASRSRRLLEPAERLARDGFVVDETFRSQTAANQARFADFPATAELFLPGGQPPATGSVFKNPDLARTYRTLGRKGVDELYRGSLARDIVSTVRKPPVDPAATQRGTSGRPDDRRPEGVPRAAPGTDEDRLPGPRRVRHRARPRPGGTSVGEALNILESTDLSKASETQYLHRLIEASRIAFADRGRWVGDPAFEDVPTRELLSQRFADSRECLIKDDAVLTSPLAPGDPRHPARCAHRGEGGPDDVRGGEHDAPDDRRQVGQRRRVHPDDRVDRAAAGSPCRGGASCSTTS